jgi:site-specific DNA recombinase
VLRDEVLAPASIASIRAQVQELLADATRTAKERAGQHSARLHEIDAEIDRLTDAVAQMGLSGALRDRLVAAEAEKRCLLTESHEVAAPVMPSGERISAKLREIAMRHDDALKTGVQRARQIVAETLGPTVIEEGDDGIYAQMNIGPALRIAVGADVSGSGCGGRLRRWKFRLR